MLALPLKTGSLSLPAWAVLKDNYGCSKKTPLKKNDHNHHDIME